jgi:PIN domain nuclease of toxin-antitoxin system
MNDVVADTHAILWLLFDPLRLSPAARSALIVGATGTVYVSAISLVEIAYLIDKGRFPEHTLDILIGVLEDPASGVVLAPVSPEVSRAVRLIPRKLVPDMPDRIVAATALQLGLPLVTKDSQIHLSNVTTIW